MAGACSPVFCAEAEASPDCGGSACCGRFANGACAIFEMREEID